MSRHNSGFDNAVVYQIKIKVFNTYDWNQPNVYASQSKPRTRADDLKQLGDMMTRRLYPCGSQVARFNELLSNIQNPSGKPNYGALDSIFKQCLSLVRVPLGVPTKTP